MDTKSFYECKSYFREPSDPNCVCEIATHCGWNFGRNEHFINPQYNYEQIALEHLYSFEENNFSDCEDLEKDQTNSYFINCDCTYCVITSNTINDKHELCFCCDKKIYLPQKHILHCYDCNSILCGNCRIQGRYSDEEEFFCFNCRRFSVHKNAEYYFKYEGFDMTDDWMFASWYY